jgi:hypothetical protein
MEEMGHGLFCIAGISAGPDTLLAAYDLSGGKEQRYPQTDTEL